MEIAMKTEIHQRQGLEWERSEPWEKQELVIKMGGTGDKNEDGDVDGMETR